MKDSQLLERVLSARDARYHLRSARLALSRAEGGPATQGELSLNVPGWPKLGGEWARVFTRALIALRGAGAGRPSPPLACEPGLRVLALRADDAGYWALLGGSAPARHYKELGCRLEDAAPWGRLLDCDWYEGDEKLTRAALGLPQRTCWVCGGPQDDCIPSLRHPLSEVRERARQLALTAAPRRTSLEPRRASRGPA